MSFINLEGEKESLHSKGEQYKEAVIRFLKSSGFRITKDSSTHGTTADLICKKPETEGSREFYVEAKDTKLSRVDQGFLRELARYLISYTEKPEPERFDLRVFARETAATDKWRYIFDNTLRRDKAIKNYYQRVLDAEGLKEEEQSKLSESQIPIEDFRKFVADCDIYQGSYETLRRHAEDLEESGRLVSEFYLQEQEPIQTTDEVSTNFYHISSLPDTVTIADVHGIDDQAEVYEENPHYYPMWVERNEVITLFAPDEIPDSLNLYIDTDTVREVPLNEWRRNEGEEKTLVFVSLLKRLITYRAVENGCISRKINSNYRIYIEHANLNSETNERNELQVSRVFYDEDDSPRFVRHRAVTIDIKHYNGHYYLFLTPTNVYTENGIEPIEGKRVKRLDDKFSQGFENNSRVKRYVRQWREILEVGEDDTGDSMFGIETEDVTGLELPVRPISDTDEQSNVMKNRRLSDYED